MIPRLIAIAVAVALSLVLTIALWRGILRLLNGVNDGTAERDPMFPEAAASVTRPPEMDENGVPVDADDDPSLHWTYEAQTPVDKTAGELAQEADAAG